MRAATFWLPKRLWGREPSAMQSALRQREAAGAKRVARRARVRRATSPRNPCAYPAPLSPWSICSQANCKAFCVSERPPLLHCCKTRPVPPYGSAFAASRSRVAPAEGALRSDLSASRECMALTSPGPRVPGASRRATRPLSSSGAKALEGPGVRQKGLGCRGRRPQPGAGGASFWACCAA